MAISVWKDKKAIKAILDTDQYLIEYLGFDPKEIYTVRATDELLGLTNDRNKIKQQIFIFNAQPEPTVNPFIYGIVYEIDVSVSNSYSGTADLAMDQILALLDRREISNTSQLELLDPPVILSSETSLYQIGCRFVSYVSKINKIQTYVKQNESEEDL